MEFSSPSEASPFVNDMDGLTEEERKRTGRSADVPNVKLSNTIVERSNFLVQVLQKAAADSLFQTPHVQERHFDTTFIAAAMQRTPQGQVEPYFDEKTQRTIHAELVLSGREYEEREGLRTPQGGELACCNGTRCYVFHIPHNPLPKQPLVGYYTPAERARFGQQLEQARPGERSTIALPANPRPCLLCIRAEVLRSMLCLHNDHVELSPHFPGSTTPIITTRIANLVDVEGEYRLEDCIKPYTDAGSTRYNGIARPVVWLNLSRMTFTLDDTGGLRVNQNLPMVGDDEQPGMSRF